MGMLKFFFSCVRMDILVPASVSFGSGKQNVPFGVDAHAQQNVRHVVIQHVEHVLPVGLQYLVLYFLMNRTQSLRAFSDDSVVSVLPSISLEISLLHRSQRRS